MQDLYYNKYRVPSARKQSWNYANEGMYFVTICTAQKEYFFGAIHSSDHDNKMYPSELGEIAAVEWFKTKELCPAMNLDLREFVVMPDHIHGIIAVGPNDYNNILEGDAMHRVSTGKQRNNHREGIHRVSATKHLKNIFK